MELLNAPWYSKVPCQVHELLLCPGLMGELDGQEVIYPLSDQTKVGCSIDGDEHTGYSAEYTSTRGEAKHDSSISVN